MALRKILIRHGPSNSNDTPKTEPLGEGGYFAVCASYPLSSWTGLCKRGSCDLSAYSTINRVNVVKALGIDARQKYVPNVFGFGER